MSIEYICLLAVMLILDIFGILFLLELLRSSLGTVFIREGDTKDTLVISLMDEPEYIRKMKWLRLRVVDPAKETSP